MRVPQVQAAYNERKMLVFPDLPFLVAGCSFLGEFWPQGLIVFGIHEEKDESKPIAEWVCGLRAYDEKRAEEIDGYGGHWVEVARFVFEPEEMELWMLLDLASRL